MIKSLKARPIALEGINKSKQLSLLAPYNTSSLASPLPLLLAMINSTPTALHLVDVIGILGGA